MLRRMGEKRASSSAGAGLVEPIHAVKDLTVFVCGLLTAALSTKSRRSLPLPCTGHSAWACALRTLHFKAKKELERRGSRGAGRVLLDELHAVESSSRAVYHLLVNSKSVPLNEGQDLELRQSVVCLKNCVAELEDGMASLESQINELIKVVVADRMALLNALAYS
ncbi:hypothetical protein SUGI_0303680 [Cryptomeria japonica]|nr:hypothetical protein SUGI_0303680 [Cryptomeria japonica]